MIVKVKERLREIVRERERVSENVRKEQVSGNFRERARE